MGEKAQPTPASSRPSFAGDACQHGVDLSLRNSIRLAQRGFGEFVGQFATQPVIGDAEVQRIGGVCIAQAELFSRGHLYRILSNPIYIGQIPHKDTSYEGNHPAIIDQQTWDAVQKQLADNVQGQRSASGAAHPSLLTGLVWDEHGNRLTSSHTSKGTRRYRYFVGPSPEAGSTRPPMRVPAQELEELVLAAIIGFLRDPQRLMALSGRVDAGKAQRRIADAATLSKRLAVLRPAELVGAAGRAHWSCDDWPARRRGPRSCSSDLDRVT